MLLEGRVSVCCVHSQILFWELDTELHSFPSQYYSPAQTKNDQVSLLILPIPSPYITSTTLIVPDSFSPWKCPRTAFLKVFFIITMAKRRLTFFFLELSYYSWNFNTRDYIFVCDMPVYLLSIHKNKMACPSRTNICLLEAVSPTWACMPYSVSLPVCQPCRPHTSPPGLHLWLK